MPVNLSATLPCGAGIGLKPAHYDALLAAVAAGGGPAWAEVHPQNYFGAGGPPHRWLTAVVDALPLSFHSVGLSLGSAAGVDAAELERLAALCDRYGPAQVSDHLSWSNGGGEYFPDLLPVPYTHAALAHFAAQVGRVQDRLGRAILVENPSRYIALAGDDYDEAEFLNLLCRRAGCGLLLDLNNIDVSAFNLGGDAAAWLDGIDAALVGEIHVAGHARKTADDGAVVAIDDHGSPVRECCWALLDHFVARHGPRPVLVEWDSDVPPFAVLMAEAERAAAALAGTKVDA
jgi:uncharacterized protein